MLLSSHSASLSRLGFNSFPKGDKTKKLGEESTSFGPIPVYTLHQQILLTFTRQAMCTQNAALYWFPLSQRYPRRLMRNNMDKFHYSIELTGVSLAAGSDRAMVGPRVPYRQTMKGMSIYKKSYRYLEYTSPLVSFVTVVTKKD